MRTQQLPAQPRLLRKLHETCLDVVWTEPPGRRQTAPRRPRPAIVLHTLFTELTGVGSAPGQMSWQQLGQNSSALCWVRGSFSTGHVRVALGDNGLLHTLTDAA